MQKPLAAMIVVMVPSMVLAQSAVTPRYGAWGIPLANRDLTVKPGDDFFTYAEGSWLKNEVIPVDRPATGYTYRMDDESQLAQRAIIEATATQPAAEESRKIGDFYAAWMDEKGIEARGLLPLRPYLTCIAAVNTSAELARVMVQPGYVGPIEVSIGTDLDEPRRYTLRTSQAQLGLPVRDYYLLKGAKYDEIRAAYRSYLTRIASLAGMPDPEGLAGRVLAFETRLSETQWTPEDRRDPVKMHHPMTVPELQAAAPAFEWPGLLDGLGVGGATRLDVGTWTAVIAASKAWSTTPLTELKAYVAIRFVSNHAAYLPKAFDEAHFAFYGRTLNGQPEQRARWKRGVEQIDDALGEAVGRIYIEQHWSPVAQAKAEELVGDMRTAYRDRIEHAPWMDEATRAQALVKLASFEPRIGYPKKWIDYSALIVSRIDPLANDVASSRFQWDLMVRRLPKPVDRGLWNMTPQTVNAYYMGTTNQITLPAAIMQPPFFDPASDPAVYYAETGATIVGHEMGHGFDDKGRKFDAQGRLHDWWSAATAGKFTARAERLATQFDNYEPLPGVRIKGHLTLGENLADLGGLETAYEAYRRYVSRHGEPPVIDGLTGDQRFFLAYAEAWQGKVRDDALRQQLLSNPHSPDKYRVNGILRNFDPWYRAFDVRPGDGLYLTPEQRVHLWTD